jgi:hypothetical protein
MAIKDFKFYATELKSEECFCGKTKKPRMSFCYRCYKSLPGDMQKDLYQPLGLEGIKEIAMVNPDAAEYLKNNIVFDDGKMTFCYIGDDRIKIIKKET